MNLREWCDQHPYEKKLILTNNGASVNRLKRITNRDGRMITNLKGSTLGELALKGKQYSMAEDRSTDRLKGVRLMDHDMAVMLLYRILKTHRQEVDENGELKEGEEREFSFVPKESLSMATAEEILRVVNILRSSKPKEEINIITSEEELEKSLQPGDSREDQLRRLVCSYELRLNEEDLYDEIRLYQEMVFLEKPLKEVTKNLKIGIFAHEKERLTFLERKVLECLSEEPLVIDPEDSGPKPENVHFYNAYGQMNEVQYVVRDILERKLPLGEVSVLCGSSEYIPLLRAEFGNRKVPFRCLAGYGISDQTVLRQVLAMLDWADSGYRYAKFREVADTALFRMGKDYTFGIQAGIGWGLDRYQQFVEQMRDHRDDFLDILLRFSRVRQPKPLADGTVPPLKTCSDGYLQLMELLIRLFASEEVKCPGRLLAGMLKIIRSVGTVDKMHKPCLMALETLSRRLEALGEMDSRAESIRLLGSRLYSMRSVDEDSFQAINILGTDRVEILERRYIYLIGLSHECFVPKVVDSPVMNDERLREFLCTDQGYVEQITDAGMEKDRKLEVALGTLSSEAELQVIYAGYNTKEFREVAASGMYMKLMETYGAAEKDIRSIGFDDAFRPGVTAEVSVDQDALYEEKEAAEAAAEVEEEASADDAAEGAEQGEVTASADSNAEGTEQGDAAEDPKKKSGISFRFVREETVNGYRFIDLRRISATALQAIMACPYVYDYYIKYFTTDPYAWDPVVWLQPSDRGTLFHYVFEQYQNQVFVSGSGIPQVLPQQGSATGQLLDQIMDQAFDDFLLITPPGSPEAVEHEKARMKWQMTEYLAYTQLTLQYEGYDVDACEEEFCTGDSYIYLDAAAGKYVEEKDPAKVKAEGIHISYHGFMDRVDVNPSGEYRIIDYKTGKRANLAKKLPADPETGAPLLLQHYIYMIALEESGRTTTGFIYDFPCDDLLSIYVDKKPSGRMQAQAADDKIGVPAREDVMQRMYDRLFDVFLKDGHSLEEDACKYCDHKDICLKKMGLVQD